MILFTTFQYTFCNMINTSSNSGSQRDNKTIQHINMKVYLASLLLLTTRTVDQIATSKHENTVDFSNIRSRAQTYKEGAQKCIDGSTTQYSECLHGSWMTRWLDAYTIFCHYQKNRIITPLISNDCSPTMEYPGECNEDSKYG